MTAQRIVPPETAFRVTRKKQPRQHDIKHLEFIRSLPCIVTGLDSEIEAAHIRYADPRYGKREVGKGEKPDDRWTVPLHYTKHREQHQTNERQWWRALGIDPTPVALALFNSSGDEETAKVILAHARRSR